MQRSTILFVAAILILGWFGSETFTVHQICATSCIDLSGLPIWGQALAVAVFPALLVLGGISLRRSERMKR
jgi:hypothetical protein